MKITRFINGNRLEKPLSSDIKVKNEVVQNTIEKVNRRIFDSGDLIAEFKEQRLYE